MLMITDCGASMFEMARNINDLMTELPEYSMYVVSEDLMLNIQLDKKGRYCSCNKL